MKHTFKVKTRSQTELIDITGEIQNIVKNSRLDQGMCTVFSPHTTSGITINENADPSVKADILQGLNKLIPMDDNYAHAEGNSAAHIKTSLVGSSEAVPISGGALALGRWQGIFLCEFDGPRTRDVQVQLSGNP
ncbi:MAG: secondary thiamine-phosphate synthase enzyme YjbQ [Candidatus Scalindua sp.]|nr:secondary thiamine-phosphate synthase enzyme YjbQ [Candidatus Scalindua sp.]